MGLFFDGATQEQINDQAARDAVNSVGNDSLAAFMSSAVVELVGRGIQSLQINTNLTIKEAAIQMDQLVWASKYSFLQTSAGHLQTLYDQTANQQVRGHLTRAIRNLTEQANAALALTSQVAVQAVGRTLGGLYFASKLEEIFVNKQNDPPDTVELAFQKEVVNYATGVWLEAQAGLTT